MGSGHQPSVINSSFFGKVYSPRLTAPISEVIIGLLRYGIQLILFAGFYIYFVYNDATIRPSIFIFLFPVIVILMAMLSLGMGVVVSSLTTKYRDLTFVLTFGLQLWRYGTPIVFSP